MTLVGDSSKARKGSSLTLVQAVAKVADQVWVEEKNRSGLSSGEGFIHEVRDPVLRWNVKDQEHEIVDPGVKDKRLLVVEPEFAAALAVMERHGNTLSQLIRQAWDGNKLATMTRNSPLKATGAHISVIGHITEIELKARLTSTNAANGFANRFLFVAVKRSKLLPHGGGLKREEIDRLGRKLQEVIANYPAVITGGDCVIATAPTVISMNDDAKRIWEDAYPSLSADRFGMLGAVTARAEAQVIRFALIYALLDGREQIEPPHLMAGTRGVGVLRGISRTHLRRHDRRGGRR